MQKLQQIRQINDIKIPRKKIYPVIRLFLAENRRNRFGVSARGETGLRCREQKRFPEIVKLSAISLTSACSSFLNSFKILQLKMKTSLQCFIIDDDIRVFQFIQHLKELFPLSHRKIQF